MVDPGDGDGSARDGVRVELAGPARLVLAESFNEGWRATCDGRDLGEPEVADGFANGWDVPADCRDVEFAFAPQRAVDVGLRALGRGVPAAARCSSSSGGAAPSARASALRASRATTGLRPRPLAAAAALALPLAAAVALRVRAARGRGRVPAAHAAPLARGVARPPARRRPARCCSWSCPLSISLFPPDDLGGHNSSYAGELLGAHWVAVAAFVLLALSLWRMLRPPPGRRRGA